MSDDTKVFPHDWLTRSTRPLGGMDTDRSRTPEHGGRLDARAAEEEEEDFILDDRSAMSAAQMVENKLTRILKDASLPVSHLQMRNLLRSR